MVIGVIISFESPYKLQMEKYAIENYYDSVALFMARVWIFTRKAATHMATGGLRHQFGGIAVSVIDNSARFWFMKWLSQYYPVPVPPDRVYCTANL